MLNQVAVITGSSRGIGAATARLMAAKGYSIVLNYQNSAGPAEALKQEISAMGVPCIAVQADVSEEDQVEALLLTGAQKARKQAQKVLKRVRSRVGF